MTNNEKIAEIKQRLEFGRVFARRHGEFKPNINDDIELLLSEIERLQEENEWLKDRYDGMYETSRYTHQQNDEFKTVNETLRNKLQSAQQEVDTLTRLVDYDTKQIRESYKREQKLIEGLREVNERAQIAQQEEDEWGWAQALKVIRQQSGAILKELGVTE